MTTIDYRVEDPLAHLGPVESYERATILRKDSRWLPCRADYVDIERYIYDLEITVLTLENQVQACERYGNPRTMYLHYTLARKASDRYYQEMKDAEHRRWRREGRARWRRYRVHKQNPGAPGDHRHSRRDLW